ncbi:hypothetical protein ES288_D12G186800v1 [Gossypium darwinii]|uniref:Reverse transcriptase zinc-binding domain-containing protein n=1 Tax=Gossypium darwinii TaxID=34276 RepID=A0A5D2ABC2_GOSDA|nr:hypothetical protein ES288_D12G186800v1 [Gossypium darwinii]
MQNFWCRHFILPKGVLKAINLCLKFFWKGQNMDAKGERVGWSTICKPKSEGGLGLKELDSRNQACIMQNLSSILIQAGPLWVAWIQAYVLRGRDLMQVSPSQTSSWSQSKILKLRCWIGLIRDPQMGELIVPRQKYSVS